MTAFTKDTKGYLHYWDSYNKQWIKTNQKVCNVETITLIANLLGYDLSHYNVESKYISEDLTGL